ncbi:MAG: LAGLIDADG endonuclease [Patescibacteria group bacterium]
MDNIVGRLQKIFSQQQIDLMIGSLLGDARLECRSSGIRYPISARLRIHQSEKQKDYVFWKYSILQDLVLKEPRRIKTWHDPERNKDHYSWYFHTKTLPELGELHHYFYKNKIKVLPENIFSFVTPMALAIWFMDDGSNTGNGFTISTHCFSMRDQLRIIDFLKKQYDITATVVKDRNKFKISIGSHEYQKLINVIEPFIIPSMKYKICNPRNDLSLNAAELINVKSSFVS